MAKKESKSKEHPQGKNVADLISRYLTEYTKWKNVLQTYHTDRFATNYRQYSAYADTKGTDSTISDPVAPELVERKLSKLFERDPKFFGMARGRNMPREVSELIANVAEYYWSNPERVADAGSTRATMKKVGREFLVIGNTATEVFFNNQTDNPDFRQVPIEDIIFNPTKSLKESDVYYIDTFLSLDEIEEMVEEEDEKGIKTGIYNNNAVQALKDKYKEKDGTVKQDPRSNRINRIGDEKYESSVEAIHVVQRWEGGKLCEIADWEVKLREVEDPRFIGDHPLQFGMDIEIPKQPYAMGMLDFISGLTAAKDLFLNQTIDYGAKALNPPLFYDPALSPLSKATLANAYKLGGMVAAKPNQAGHQQMPPMPQEGFGLLTYMQQRSESVTGVGAYVGGVPNQVSDKTEGTKGGIEALIAQGASPIRDAQMTLEEGIIEPMVNKWLKMAGELMGDDEIKYIFISGQQPKWVQITKGILTGKITLDDMFMAELIKEEEYTEIAQIMLEDGKEPSEELIFDIDWIIKVETGSLAEIDTREDIENFARWVAFNRQNQVPIDMRKVSMEMAMRSGVKEPEQYLVDQEQLPNQIPGIGQQPQEPGANPPPGQSLANPLPAI